MQMEVLLSEKANSILPAFDLANMIAANIWSILGSNPDINDSLVVPEIGRVDQLSRKKGTKVPEYRQTEDKRPKSALQLDSWDLKSTDLGLGTGFLALPAAINKLIKAGIGASVCHSADRAKATSGMYRGHCTKFCTKSGMSQIKNLLAGLQFHLQ
jgi:hypothetical protein